MKRIRFICIVLLLAFGLTACSDLAQTVKDKLQDVIDPTKNTEEAQPVVTMPVQREMPEAEKKAALHRLEYAVLCAAMDADMRQKTLEGWYISNDQVYLGDFDGDGVEELVGGNYAHTFDVADRDNSYTFSQSGIELYIDKNGTLYRKENVSGSYQYELDGMQVLGEGMDVWYNAWNGSLWEAVFREGYSFTKEILVDEKGWFVGYGKTISEETYAQIRDERVSTQVYEAYQEELGLEKLDTLPGDYTENRFDPAYTDSLLSSMEDYFGQYYNVRRISSDIDFDGFEEDLLFVRDITDYWLEHMTLQEMDTPDIGWHYLEYVMRPDRERVCVLIADQEDGRLVMDAHCILADLNIQSGMTVTQSGGFLWVNDHPVYRGGGTILEEPMLLAQYVSSYGFSDCVIKAVDVSDRAGMEYMCLCRSGDMWYLLIFIIEDGEPKPIYSRDLLQTAVYLVEHNGRQCLLTYSQYVDLYMGNYAYDLLRFDADGNTESLDYQSVGYDSGDADATQIAQFFERLNVYLLKIFVIRDPYRLTGYMWLKPEDADYGSVPAEELAQEPQAGGNGEEEIREALGFVQINDPSSWLNLREGPGTQYPCVRLDPSDPDSIVKQALGSPVTVLETIETGDAANPVWVKVRITYGDREIIGYSSRRYIRLVGEE